MDGCDQLSNAGERTPADGLVRELGEPPLDQVEPGGTGGDEMQLEARILSQPGPDLGVGVGAVVVQDQMQFQILGELALKTGQELQELLVAMPKVDLADHGAVEQVERGEEGGSAVALVVMGHGPAAPLLEGQSRLGPVYGLDLTLLIDAEHDRVFGRIQIEPDHVGQLFDEARIVGEFEAGDPVRLQLMCSPDPRSEEHTSELQS